VKYVMLVVVVGLTILAATQLPRLPSSSFNFSSPTNTEELSAEAKFQLACEDAIKEVIATPSSFKTIKYSGKVLEFDAQNGFGATIRSIAICHESPSLDADGKRHLHVAPTINGEFAGFKKVY
jgi:hypothetical protein